MKLNLGKFRRSRLFCSVGAGSLLGLALLVALSSRGAESTTPAPILRIALAYNSSIFTDEELQRSTEAVLSTSLKVELTPLPYARPGEFRKLWEETELSNTGRWDLVLGPTESAALKALNDSLETQARVPFLAPFVTTPPKAYRHLEFIPAAPGDEDRVKTAVSEFVQYAASRTLALLHSDDVWGQSIVQYFRGNLRNSQIVVHAQPVEEFTEEDDENETVAADNTQLYRSFLEKMRAHGATIIGVALLTAEAANQFLETLHQFNSDLLVSYKPTILFLSQPGFDPQRTSAGVLYKYLTEFSVFYVADRFTAKAIVPSQIKASWAPHMDACRVIAAAAQACSNSVASAGPRQESVKLVEAFYKGLDEADKLGLTKESFLTAYHAKKLHFDERELEVRQVTVSNDCLEESSMSNCFESGRLRQLFYASWFFALHHRVLWNYWTVMLFGLVAFGSFYHVIELKSERPAWMLLKTRPFWSLFCLNLVLTYVVWVMSISFGVFGDCNLAAALALAAACPTAGSALGDIARRYLPFDMSGIIRIIEELNRKLIDSIGKEKLQQYKERLQQLSLDGLQRAFFEVLFLKLTSDDLRNRLHEQLQTGLALVKANVTQMRQGGLPDSEVQKNEKQQKQQLYTDSLIRALGYLCASERELGDQMNQILSGSAAPAIA